MSVLEFARPSLLDEACRTILGLTLVLGDLGAAHLDESFLMLAKHERVFAEISGVVRRPWSLYTTLLSAFERGVAHKLLFASGYPDEAPQRAIERIYSVNADPAGNSFAGVMFWATDYDNYYYALIAGDGAVGIFRRQRGKTLKQTDWTVFDAANKGKEAVNELRVVTIGKEASVYVNGKLFKTMKGQPPENGQEIGVRATSSKGEKAIYAFDDIKVTEPDTAKSN